MQLSRQASINSLFGHWNSKSLNTNDYSPVNNDDSFLMPEDRKLVAGLFDDAFE